MDEAKNKKIANYVTLAVLCAVGVWIVSLFAGGQSFLPEAERLPAIQAYYTKIKSLGNDSRNLYSHTVTSNSIPKAYQAFKSDVGQSIRGTAQLLFEEKSKVPKVPESDLLKQAVDYLAMSASARREAVENFIDSVEKNNPGKLLEAKAENEKADRYLDQGNQFLDEIATKYNLAK